MTIVLMSAGAALELLGIALVGASDVVPGVRRGAVLVDGYYRRVKGRAWRLLGRPRHALVEMSVRGAATVSAHLSTLTGTDATDVAGQLGYLLRESERTQRRLNDLERTSETMREEVKAELAHLNEELVAYVEQTIRTALAEYAVARKWGLVCLAVATVLLVAATVV